MTQEMTNNQNDLLNLIEKEVEAGNIVNNFQLCKFSLENIKPSSVSEEIRNEMIIECMERILKRIEEEGQIEPLPDIVQVVEDMEKGKTLSLNGLDLVIATIVDGSFQNFCQTLDIISNYNNEIEFNIPLPDGISEIKTIIINRREFGVSPVPKDINNVSFSYKDKDGNIETLEHETCNFLESLAIVFLLQNILGTFIAVDGVEEFIKQGMFTKIINYVLNSSLK